MLYGLALLLALAGAADPAARAASFHDLSVKTISKPSGSPPTRARSSWS
jgi:hypothetical protein